MWRTVWQTILVVSVSVSVVAACSAKRVAEAAPGPDEAAAPSLRDSIADRQNAAGFRVMTYNIAHGRGQSFHQALLSRKTVRANLTSIGGLIADQSPQVVALQELDGPSVWSGNFDHGATLARVTGYPGVFQGHHGSGSSRLKLDYGTGIITEFPIADQQSQVFDTSWRDNKGFVKTVLETGIEGAEEIGVVSVHLDFISPGKRKRQLDILARALEQRSRPLVVMGDFNCSWEADDCVRSFAGRLDLHTHSGEIGTPTFPSDGPRKQLDWILISSDLMFKSHETLPEGYSDHLAVAADIALSPSKTAGGNRSRLESKQESR